MPWPKTASTPEPAPELKDQPAMSTAKTPWKPARPLVSIYSAPAPRPPAPPSPKLQDDRTAIQRQAQALIAEAERRIAMNDTTTMGYESNSVTPLDALRIVAKLAALVSKYADHLAALEAEQQRQDS